MFHMPMSSPKRIRMLGFFAVAMVVLLFLVAGPRQNETDAVRNKGVDRIERRGHGDCGIC
jgi:hypothetical protein